MSRTAHPLLPVALAVTLVVGACSSGNNESSTNTTLLRQVTDVKIETIDVVATEYVRRLGDEGAFVAVFLALDRGYSGRQVLAMSSELHPDGVIEDVEPLNPPVGATDLGEGAGEDESASAGRPTAQPVGYQGAPSAQDDPAPTYDPAEAGLLGLELTVGDLHRDFLAQQYWAELGIDPTDRLEESGTHPEASADGVWTLAGLLTLAMRGYTTDQIAFGAVTGTIFRDPPDSNCLVVKGEAPLLDDDRLRWMCKELPTRENPDEDGGASTTTDAPDDFARPDADPNTEPNTKEVYCDAWAGYWSAWGGDAASISIQTLATAWVELTAVAPVEIRADMEVVQGIWDRGAASNTQTSLYESDGPDANAVATVTIYVDDVCGIDIGGD